MGESRDYLPVMRVRLRCGISRMMTVLYGVAEDRDIVFVREYRVNRRWKPPRARPPEFVRSPPRRCPMRFASAFFALLTALPCHAGEFRVGFGEADLTPEVGAGKKPVFLAGFGQNRKAATVHDPITARAVVMADGDEKIALVSVDVVVLFLPSV